MNAPHPNREFMALGWLLPLVLAGACVATMLIGETWLIVKPHTGIPAQQIVRLCVALRVTGGMRVSTWWSAAISTRGGLIRHPFLRSSVVCGQAPWQPWLPTSGSFESSS